MTLLQGEKGIRGPTGPDGDPGVPAVSLLQLILRLRLTKVTCLDTDSFMHGLLQATS